MIFTNILLNSESTKLHSHVLESYLQMHGMFYSVKDSQMLMFVNFPTSGTHNSLFVGIPGDCYNVMQPLKV